MTLCSADRTEATASSRAAVPFSTTCTSPRSAIDVWSASVEEHTAGGSVLSALAAEELVPPRSRRRTPHRPRRPAVRRVNASWRNAHPRPHLHLIRRDEVAGGGGRRLAASTRLHCVGRGTIMTADVTNSYSGAPLPDIPDCRTGMALFGGAAVIVGGVLLFNPFAAVRTLALLLGLSPSSGVSWRSLRAGSPAGARRDRAGRRPDRRRPPGRVLAGGVGLDLPS